MSYPDVANSLASFASYVWQLGTGTRKARPEAALKQPDHLHGIRIAPLSANWLEQRETHDGKHQDP